MVLLLLLMYLVLGASDVVEDGGACAADLAVLSSRVTELESSLDEIKTLLRSIDNTLLEEPDIPDMPEGFEEAEYRELLLGAGRSTLKKIPVNHPQWQYLVTLDQFDKYDPDIVWNLEMLPLPFPDQSFDEIHAYEVLEHVGQQGDVTWLFAQFEEFYRILKPGGLFVGSTPGSGGWVWGDPSHTRYFGRETLTYLDQSGYIDQVNTPLSDFSDLYNADFATIVASEGETHMLQFVLVAVKPSRKGLSKAQRAEVEADVVRQSTPKLEALQRNTANFVN